MHIVVTEINPFTVFKMLKRINQLEQASAGLEPSADVRKELIALTVDYAESFLHRLPGGQTFEPDKGRSKLLEQAFVEEPGDLPGLLGTLKEAVNFEGINPASGGHLGYIPGGGIYPSALEDFLADVTNCYSGVAFASPGGVKMEQQLVQWMAGLVAPEAIRACTVSCCPGRKNLAGPVFP